MSAAVQLHTVEALKPVESLDTSGALLQAQLERYVGAAAPKAVERTTLRLTETVGEDFLLADVPVLSLTNWNDDIQLGVPLRDAWLVAMPITPRLIVSLGPPQSSQADVDRVLRTANILSIRQARQEVYYHPDSGLEDLARALRPMSIP